MGLATLVETEKAPLFEGKVCKPSVARELYEAAAPGGASYLVRLKGLKQLSEGVWQGVLAVAVRGCVNPEHNPLSPQLYMPVTVNKDGQVLDIPGMTYVQRRSEIGHDAFTYGPDGQLVAVDRYEGYNEEIPTLADHYTPESPVARELLTRYSIPEQFDPRRTAQMYLGGVWQTGNSKVALTAELIALNPLISR